MKLFTQFAKDNNFLYTELHLIIHKQGLIGFEKSLIPVITYNILHVSCNED